MRNIARKIQGFGNFWGFDSFTGLPEETRGMMLEGKHWLPGGFSAADAMRNYDRASLLTQIRTHINWTNTQLIPGYFNESLGQSSRGGSGFSRHSWSMLTSICTHPRCSA